MGSVLELRLIEVILYCEFPIDTFHLIPNMGWGKSGIWRGEDGVGEMGYVAKVRLGCGRVGSWGVGVGCGGVSG